MIVDRQKRDVLIGAINRYLDGKTTAFEFDDEIFGIESDDPAIHIVRQLWYFYDDCKDHTVQLAEGHWDLIQRLVLILRSDAQIEISTRRRWDLRSLLAGALLLFVYAATWFGFGKQLLALAIPFGVVSIANLSM